MAATMPCSLPLRSSAAAIGIVAPPITLTIKSGEWGEYMVLLSRECRRVRRYHDRGLRDRFLRPVFSGQNDDLGGDALAGQPGFQRGEG